jgi:hypothetical protein
MKQPLHDKSQAGRYTRKHILIVVCAVVCIAAAIFAALMIVNRDSGDSDKSTTSQAGQQSEELFEPATGHIETRILFMGDMFWGRAVNKWAQASPLKEKYPFSRLGEFNRAGYDAWVANLECPSVPGVDQPYSLEVQSLLFNCPSTYLPEAAKWFTAFSLANNHTANQGGQTGIDATRTALSAQGIQHFGHYDPAILSDVCEVVAMPARLQENRAPAPGRKIMLPMAFCGYHGLGAMPSTEALGVMKRYSAYMPVIAYPHMGVEYASTPTASQQALYRAMVDNGADAVLAAHPHWVQPAEVYKGKLIVYSMGNFMFDQEAGETQRGAAIDLTLTSKGAIPVDELAGWDTVGKHCAVFKDDCLRRLNQQKLQRLPWSFEYVAHGVDMSGRLTHRADADLTAIILQRLNWPTVQLQLTEVE